MCFHNSMSKKATDLAARYRRKSDLIEIINDIVCNQYHVNAFTFPRCPVITESEQIQPFTWGLIPSWVKNIQDAEEMRKMTLNARAETVFHKPSYKESILSKRCLVPSTGYIEWRHEKDRNIPYIIFLSDEDVFSLAGIYDTWIDEINGKSYNSFSILTTQANGLTSYIHNTKKRMPVIIEKCNEEKWLDSSTSIDEIQEMFKPYYAEKMDAYQIGYDIMSKKPNDPTIINRV